MTDDTGQYARLIEAAKKIDIQSLLGQDDEEEANSHEVEEDVANTPEGEKFKRLREATEIEQKNLSLTESIEQLGRAIDEFLRNHVEVIRKNTELEKVKDALKEYNDQKKTKLERQDEERKLTQEAHNEEKSTFEKERASFELQKAEASAKLHSKEELFAKTIEASAKEVRILEAKNLELIENVAKANDETNAKKVLLDAKEKELEVLTKSNALTQSEKEKQISSLDEQVKNLKLEVEAMTIETEQNEILLKSNSKKLAEITEQNVKLKAENDELHEKNSVNVKIIEECREKLGDNAILDMRSRFEEIQRTRVPVVDLKSTENNTQPNPIPDPKPTQWPTPRLLTAEQVLAAEQRDRARKLAAKKRDRARKLAEGTLAAKPEGGTLQKRTRHLKKNFKKTKNKKQRRKMTIKRMRFSYIKKRI